MKIPLFPLNVVLYPKMPLPLHIFEPRYKEMVNYCLEKKEPFGVVLSHKDILAKVGTLAKIENLLQQFPDGRMNILCLGHDRFRILEIHQDQSYLQGEVEIISDEEEDARHLVKLVAKGKVLLRNYTTLTGKQANPELFDHYNPDTFSFLLSELSDMSLIQHQSLLEMTSTIQRLHRVLCHMDKLMQKFRLNKKIQHLVDSDQDFSQICN